MDKYGIAKIMEMALNDVDPDGKKGYHISFDIDALDRFEAPSTGTRSELRFKQKKKHSFSLQPFPLTLCASK